MNKDDLKEAKIHYDNWAVYFNLLKSQFQDTWELFEKLEKNGWNRLKGSFSEYDFFGASGYGYVFYASLKNEDGREITVATVKKDYPYREKLNFNGIEIPVMEIKQIHGAIGDEGNLVGAGQLYFNNPRYPKNLFGFDNIAREQFFEPSYTEKLEERLSKIGLLFHVFIPTRPPQLYSHIVDLSFLQTNSLVNVCSSIYDHLNQRNCELEKLPVPNLLAMKGI